MQYQLFVMDVDGTLVGGDSQPAPGAAQAIHAAEAAGVRVALSTGRTVAACARLLDSLPMRGPHIFFDGSLVLDPATGAALLARQVDPAAVVAVLDFAEANALTAEVYTRTGYFVRAMTPEVAAHAQLQGVTPTLVPDLRAIVARGDVIKAELVLATDDGRAQLRAFEPTQAGRLRFSWATAPGLPALSFINVVAPGVSKGEALRTIAAHLSLPLTAVAAIGDSANDLPMFAVAGLSIAMGNAPLAVQQAAQVVTGRLEAGGLAQAIHRFILAAAPTA